LGNIYQEAAHVRQRRRVGDRLVDVYDPASTHAVTPAIMFNPDTEIGRAWQQIFGDLARLRIVRRKAAKNSPWEFDEASDQWRITDKNGKAHFLLAESW
jgi:hypothetical protein